MHGACERGEAACNEAGLRRLLDEMSSLAVRRSRRFIAWEYAFDFGGGSPPWMSGMAQATGIQALARAAELLDEPRYLATARKALGAFETLPPTGVRTSGPAGGVHYLQYSFAPRLYIFNAFLQSLIGLHDFGRLAGDERATELYREAEPEARKEVPALRRGRLVALLLRRRGVDRRLPRAAARVPPVDVHAPAGQALLRLRRALPRLPGRSARAGLHRARADGRGRPDRAPLHALQALGGGGAGAAPGRAARLLAPGHLPPRHRRLRLAPARAGHLPVELAAKELRTGLGKKDRATAEIAVENAPG